MAKAKKQGVVAKGNARIRGNRDVATAVSESGVSDASRDELNTVKRLQKEGETVKSKVTGKTAYSAAAEDAKGTEYEVRDDLPTPQRESRTAEFHRDVTGKPHRLKVDQMTASMNFLRDLSAASEPSRARVKSQLASTQDRFEKAAPGPEKEKHRRSIGKMLQQGTIEGSGINRLACQTPGCNRSVPAFPEKGDIGDVVCNNCNAAGDLAGREYKDRPSDKGRD